MSHSERAKLPGAFDLIEWIKMRKRMSTGMAKKLILSGAIRLDGEPVGYVTDITGTKRLTPLIPSERRMDLEVVVP